MPDNERILRSLQQEFKPMDRKYSQGELRVFDVADDQDHEVGYQKNVDNFQKREANLINLMDKLDDLGQMMKQFHSLSNSVIAQGDVLTDFSANESTSTENGVENKQGSAPAEDGINQRYNSMDTVVGPSMQNLFNDSTIPLQASRNSLLQNANTTTEAEDNDPSSTRQTN
ncbi:unnamed protein product [Umbelopsis ramanniana]